MFANTMNSLVNKQLAQLGALVYTEVSETWHYHILLHIKKNRNEMFKTGLIPALYRQVPGKSVASPFTFLCTTIIVATTPRPPARVMVSATLLPTCSRQLPRRLYFFPVWLLRCLQAILQLPCTSFPLRGGYSLRENCEARWRTN